MSPLQGDNGMASNLHMTKQQRYLIILCTYIVEIFKVIPHYLFPPHDSREGDLEKMTSGSV